MDPTKTNAANKEDGDEWELFNDDGFVHKRRKRRTVNSPPPPPPRPPQQNPEEEERRRIERKEKLLLKLKSEYEREISYWELLSNNVRAMEDEAREAREEEEATTSLLCVENVGGETERSSGSVLDELQKQVEAQEAIMREMSRLCDTVDEICNAQEEAFKNSLFDLPIWDSPRRLMKSLCDE